MRQKFVLRQGAVAIRVERGCIEHMPTIVMVADTSGYGEGGEIMPDNARPPAITMVLLNGLLRFSCWWRLQRVV